MNFLASILMVSQKVSGMAQQKVRYPRRGGGRASGGVHVVRRALRDPAATREIGLFATPSILQRLVSASCSFRSSSVSVTRYLGDMATTLVG